MWPCLTRVRRAGPKPLSPPRRGRRREAPARGPEERRAATALRCCHGPQPPPAPPYWAPGSSPVAGPAFGSQGTVTDSTLLAGMRPVRGGRAGRILVVAGLALLATSGASASRLSLWGKGGGDNLAAADGSRSAQGLPADGPVRVEIPVIGIAASVDPLGLKKS